MRNKQNESLFWYNIGAEVKIYIGVILLIVAAILSFVTEAILSIGITFTAIALIIWGKYQKFNYKRQSGQIIHKGEWN